VFLICRLTRGAFTIASSAPTLIINLNERPIQFLSFYLALSVSLSLSLSLLHLILYCLLFLDIIPTFNKLEVKFGIFMTSAPIISPFRLVFPADIFFQKQFITNDIKNFVRKRHSCNIHECSSCEPGLTVKFSTFRMNIQSCEKISTSDIGSP
jgi:hypothetical protein